MNEMIPDIYKITETVNDVQKRFMEDISEDTLTTSTYGYLNEITSNSIQNAIVMAAENANEAFPIRAKFEKNIITNAISYNIEDINAIPAKMEVMLGFVEQELIDQMTNDVFILDKDCKFLIGDFEFHLDYDMMITRDIINNDSVYAARYEIDRTNILSDITNPYLAPPVLLDVNHDRFLFINCSIRQIEMETIHRKVISNNILDNKTFDFEFESQLANFDIYITEGSKAQFLTPIFEGMPYDGVDKYCFYTYLDANTIRVKFDRNSYEPKLNCDIEIRVKTTQGSAGIFTYTDDVISGLESNRFSYGNLFALIKPITGSEYGIDRKSIKDLKQIIPRQMLSRGNITNTRDVENFFNTIDNNRLMFYRRRDNQFERLYYAYMLVKDNMNNIIPTNTVDLCISPEQFDASKDKRFMLNPGHLYELGKDNIAHMNNSIVDGNIYDKEEKGFLYACPYLCTVNSNPLSVSYYLNIINNNYYFRFSYINQRSVLQFISTSLNISKPYQEYDEYTFTMDIMQNMNIDKDLVEFDKDGNITMCKIKPVLMIQTEGNYKYYVYGEIVAMDDSLFRYTVKFNLKTDNTIDYHNRIKINDIYIGGSDVKSYVYLEEAVKMTVAVLVEFDEEYGRDDLDTVIPGLEGYTLCNKYEVSSDVNLFYNYSGIIKSTVNVIQNEDKDGYTYKIKGVPCVRYSYLDDKERCADLINYVQYRKAYIDEALKVIEDSFSIDFKFFNTYGPSKMFKIGHDKETLNKVNLKLTFKVKLKVGASKYASQYIIESIKEYIENINVIKSIHMSNLTAFITDKFKSDLEFIEFYGINNYDALYQYLEKIETKIIEDVPEFLNINLTKDLKPDIDIILI